MNLIIDFDSTLITTEGLDALAEVCSSKDLNLIKEIEEITNMGMTGQISIEESLTKRILRLNATKKELEILNQKLKNYLSPSIDILKEFISKHPLNVFVISGGFLDYVLPICKEIGVLESHVYANTFEFEDEKIIGFDKKNPLSKNKGKSTIVARLNLSKTSYMIGDGYTDFEVKLENKVDYFIAFTETVTRETVTKNADFICKNFNEVINLIHEQRT